MLYGMWDLSSLARNRTHAPCIGSVESYSLDCQGNPKIFLRGQESKAFQHSNNNNKSETEQTMYLN